MVLDDAVRVHPLLSLLPSFEEAVWIDSPRSVPIHHSPPVNLLWLRLEPDGTSVGLALHVLELVHQRADREITGDDLLVLDSNPLTLVWGQVKRWLLPSLALEEAQDHIDHSTPQPQVSSFGQAYTHHGVWLEPSLNSDWSSAHPLMRASSPNGSGL